MHVPTGAVIAEHVDAPRTFVGRGIGLMFRRHLDAGSGMWINPCEGGSIHMLFMNFPIDAVFLDREERIKKVYHRLPAWWGVVWFVWGAQSVLELPAGTAATLGLAAGDKLQLAPG